MVVEGVFEGARAVDEEAALDEQNRRRWTLRKSFVSTTVKDLATLLH